MKNLTFFKIALLGVILFAGSGITWGQTSTVFKIEFATTNAEVINGFKEPNYPNIGIAFSNTATKINQTSTNASTGYTGASGLGVVLLSSSNLSLTLTNVNTNSYTDLSLSFGLKRGKSNDQASGNIKVEYQDVANNGNWTELTLPTSTFNTAWTLIQATGTIPSTSNLSLRFTHLNTTSRGIDDILLTGTTASSCTSLGTPSVTATPGNGQATLSWDAVTNASSYTLIWNGGAPETVTSPVTKTGLTNGTTYSYSVVAVGDGTTYCATNTPATGNVTPIAPPPPAAPIATDATFVTLTGFTVNWGAVSGATGYKLDVYTANITEVLNTGFEGSTSFPDGWTQNSSYVTNNSAEAYAGSNFAGMNAVDDYFYTPLLSSPSTITFRTKASSATANNTVKVQYSSNAISWTDLATYSANGSNTGDITSTYSQKTINANLTGSYYIRWFISARSGGSAYFDEVKINSGTKTYVTGYQDLTVSGTSLAVSGLSAGTTYYYVVRATNANGTSTNSNEISVTTPKITFTGTGDWTTAGNWNSGAVPANTADVIIDGTAAVSSNVDVAGVTINAGKSLTVNTGKQLTVNSALVNNGTFNVQTGATVITNGTISGSGTTNIEQNFTGDGRAWWYVSSPLTAANSNVFRPEGSSNLIGDYNEATTSYSTTSFGANSSTPLLAGKGYAVKFASTTGGTYTFTGGLLNTGNVSLTPTRTGTAVKRGFNLVGNPYPSYLNWNAVYADATNPAVNMRNAIWFRTYDKDKNEMVFHTYGDGDAVPEITSPLIAPMQAFWVKVNADGSNGSLTFKNTHRSHFTEGANPLKVKASEIRPRLRMVVSNGTNSDEMLIVGKSYASNNLDSYDIEKMSTANTAIPEIYSVVGSDELVINSMNTLTEGTTVNLGFRPGQTGSFTIEATQLENIDTKVMLLDKVAVTEQELTAGIPYTFSVEDAAATNDRFVIKLVSKVPTGIEIGAASRDMTVFTNCNNRVQVIYNGEISAQTAVSVYNVAGQKLNTQKITKAATELNGNFRPGVYMVQLTDNEKKITKKLVIK